MTYYDEIAKGYDELHKEEQVKKLKIIKDKLYVDSSDKLLDVGCGTGFSQEFIKCRWYGIDPSSQLLKFCKGECKQARAEDIPYPDKEFDVVISITAIQNFEDIEIGLKEIKRVAKDDAQVVISCLKKSSKLGMIRESIKKYFEIKEEVEEEKDIIFVLQ